VPRFAAEKKPEIVGQFGLSSVIEGFVLSVEKGSPEPNRTSF
jgi:hypothetical protein